MFLSPKPPSKDIQAVSSLKQLCHPHLFRILALHLLSSIIALMTAYKAEAIEADPVEPFPPYLFMTVENAGDIQIRQSPIIVRSRLVNVDFSLLAEPEENFIAEPDSEI